MSWSCSCTNTSSSKLSWGVCGHPARSEGARPPSCPMDPVTMSPDSSSSCGADRRDYRSHPDPKGLSDR
eukprot:4106965-Alexandrium_andersonii.AAC.1